jgi:uncharacterized membrane protein
MKKEILFGNLLLMTLMVLSYIFFFNVFKGEEDKVFNAGITMFIFLFFYFLGKGICKSMKSKNGTFLYTYRLLVIIFSLIIPLALGFLYLSIASNFITISLGIFLLIIGLDIKGYIDSAFEEQLYKEFEVGRDYLFLYTILYVGLATALLIFYPILKV